MVNEYVTLGRSGLRVSPLCLGTMTFGTEWGWGADEAGSRRLFDKYIDAGGNFVDTADGYTGGRSETMVGAFVAERGLRDRVVLATKFTFSADPANPNAGGNGRKNMLRALEGSLGRLQTDYVDLYWLHAWDRLTPVEEVVDAFDGLVRAGKVRYYGFSDVPAWYVARAQTIAEREGKARPIALQLEYSLVERTIEREHVPAARELGLGICPWSPLASGLLTGKYRRADAAAGRGRLDVTKDSGNPGFEKFTDRNFDIAERLVEIARAVGRSPAQVALNWVATRPGVASTIVGATKESQLDDNLAALDFALPADARQRLDEASALERGHPYMFFEEPFRTMINGRSPVRRPTEDWD